MKKNYFRLLLVLGCLLGFATSWAEQKQPIPIDSKVRCGKLDNGLTYYIRQNKEPKNRADFYIVQNVGAILENDNQNGLAHFLEHMAFNGTKNYPGKNLINYMESIGVKFGDNINAYTSLDETVYNLSDVPTTRTGIIDSALLVLHDWSGYISLDEKEIDNERGVIREEWRTGNSAERRMLRETNRLKYPGSQYSKRDVIGDTSIINNFSYQTLRNYYKKWYRPDLQAIIIVGDIDINQIEEKIKKTFAEISKKENEGERPIYKILDNAEPIITIVKDQEARMTRIELEYKHDVLPADVNLSISGYAHSLANSLISLMISERFDEITQQADAPFVGAYGTYGELVKSKDAFQLLAIPKEGKETEGLKALLLEAEKMKRFGFTNSELERAKINTLKSFQNLYNERDHIKNSSLVNEYIRHFLNNEPIPGIEWEYTTATELLKKISLDIINERVKSFITDSNMIISVAGPGKESVNLPTVKEVKSLLATTKTAPITENKDIAFNKEFVEKDPKKGRIIKTFENKTLGTTEWQLKNGIKVIIKPTPYKKDEVLLTSFSTGGLSKLKNLEDLASANFSTTIVSNNGIGKYSSVEINKMLSGKVVSVSPSISNYEEGFTGNSSVSDFKTMLQIVYLYFTAPRRDDNAFTALVNGYKTITSNREKDPRTAFSDSIKLTIGGHNQRIFITKKETLEKINQEKAIEFFKERFAIPADFTFIFVGNINPADTEVQDLICTYLGGLKSTKKTEELSDVNIRIPKGKISNYFEKEMTTKKASNFVAYSGKMSYNLSNLTTMNVIENILNIRYTELIREKEGGSYSVGVGSKLGNIPTEQALLLMQFDTDPSKQSRMIEIIHNEVNKLAYDGAKPEELLKVKGNMQKVYDEAIRTNNWWVDALQQYYQKDINMISNYKNEIESIDNEKIKETLKSLTNQGNTIEVVMTPYK